jgi:vanillate O-demethylase ferredoxin subunit
MPGPHDHLYVCGPAGFIDWILSAARNAGWSDAQLHREYFAAPTQDAGDVTAFEVSLASNGRTFIVPPDRTVVEVLADAGVEIAVSCAQGVCGTCLTGVLSGVPDHQDYYLSDDEKAANDCFTPCCSRAKTPTLVIDL